MTSAGFTPLTLRRAADPVATIVICAYGQIERTYHCLWCITRTHDTTPYEVIVVDDASPDNTAAVLAEMEGVQVIANETNQGYLRSANRGIAAARGEFVVLLNNDTGVRSGWLDALVARARSAPDIGAVGARLVGADGLVQEAGGIVWSDATGFNYGRGFPLEDLRVRHARDVDYASAAALLVRGDLLRELGGFDERYAPAYYEDTDLAFRLRDRGFRVVYEPMAVVDHAEGASYGTDPELGGKRHQAINREVFAGRWATELRGQPAFSPEIVPLARTRAEHRILVLETRLPDDTRDSASVRLTALLREMRALGWAVSLHHLDAEPNDPAVTRLGDLGVHVFDPARDFREQVAELAPGLDAIWVARPNVASGLLVAATTEAPRAVIVYDSVDLHFIRDRRRGEHGGERVAGRVIGVEMAYELAAVRAADLTLAISDEEARALAEHVPDARIRVLGNVHEPEVAAASPTGRHDVLFVGGWEHGPNLDAARRLAHDVMPRVRARVPGARLLLAGSHVTPEVRALAGPDVDVLGWLPSLTPALAAARVFVAPLTWGAGAKGKVGQALAHGLPVVTTAIGAEGMGLTPGVQILVEETDDEIADAVVDVMTDDALWQRLSDAGIAHLRATLGREVAATRLRAVLDEVLALGRDELATG